MRGWVLVLLRGAILLLLCQQGSPGEDVLSTWTAGNEAYREGRFDEAIERYQAVLSQSPTGWGYYNLGNAHFKAGQLGLAVLAYKRAERLMPRAKEVKENLSLALRAAGIAEEPSASVAQAFGKALSLLTVTEWLCAFSTFGASGILIGIVWTLTGRRGLRPFVVVFLAGGGVILGLLALRSGLVSDRTEAVVLAKEAYGYVAPGEGETPAFKVTEGSVVFLSDRTKGAWIEVRLADGTRGWMDVSGVAPVRQTARGHGGDQER